MSIKRQQSNLTANLRKSSKNYTSGKVKNGLSLKKKKKVRRQLKGGMEQKTMRRGPLTGSSTPADGVETRSPQEVHSEEEMSSPPLPSQDDLIPVGLYIFRPNPPSGRPSSLFLGKEGVVKTPTLILIEQITEKIRMFLDKQLAFKDIYEQTQNLPDIVVGDTNITPDKTLKGITYTSEDDDDDDSVLYKFSTAFGLLCDYDIKFELIPKMEHREIQTTYVSVVGDTEKNIFKISLEKKEEVKKGYINLAPFIEVSMKNISTAVSTVAAAGDEEKPAVPPTTAAAAAAAVADPGGAAAAAPDDSFVVEKFNQENKASDEGTGQGTSVSPTESAATDTSSLAPLTKVKDVNYKVIMSQKAVGKVRRGFSVINNQFFKSEMGDPEKVLGDGDGVAERDGTIFAYKVNDNTPEHTDIDAQQILIVHCDGDGPSSECSEIMKHGIQDHDDKDYKIENDNYNYSWYSSLGPGYGNGSDSGILCEGIREKIEAMYPYTATQDGSQGKKKGVNLQNILIKLNELKKIKILKADIETFLKEQTMIVSKPFQNPNNLQWKGDVFLDHSVIKLPFTFSDDELKKRQLWVLNFGSIAAMIGKGKIKNWAINRVSEEGGIGLQKLIDNKAFQAFKETCLEYKPEQGGGEKKIKNVIGGGNNTLFEIFRKDKQVFVPEPPFTSMCEQKNEFKDLKSYKMTDDGWTMEHLKKFQKLLITKFNEKMREVKQQFSVKKVNVEDMLWKENDVNTVVDGNTSPLESKFNKNNLTYVDFFKALNKCFGNDKLRENYGQTIGGFEMREGNEFSYVPSEYFKWASGRIKVGGDIILGTELPGDPDDKALINSVKQEKYLDDKNYSFFASLTKTPDHIKSKEIYKYAVDPGIFDPSIKKVIKVSGNGIVMPPQLVKSETAGSEPALAKSEVNNGWKLGFGNRVLNYFAKSSGGKQKSKKNIKKQSKKRKANLKKSHRRL